MSDYVAHANRAKELIDELEQKSKGRLGPDHVIQMAQVEATLALAAAINGREQGTLPK
ncbi:hypothetical protein JCM4814A_04270 [Streptomyces phaeofaciens JCM 4814]|uniref:Uncharacterized protein n=1 Tax=Streptomyces phaeofaciens TaxID=68254 RepID=A0A918M2A1_9ACTN|nr:hypothetical protein [Streptomyces phaeofaciens]GGU01249.1 hypothetical protein GCM10010226_92330 [Streptomyces phaeofaciens]